MLLFLPQQSWYSFGIPTALFRIGACTFGAVMEEARFTDQESVAVNTALSQSATAAADTEAAKAAREKKVRLKNVVIKKKCFESLSRETSNSCRTSPCENRG